MKTIYVFLFVAGYMGLNAQVWAPIGATWHYRALFNSMGYVTDGTYEIKATGTTYLQNHIVTKLSKSFHGARYIAYPGQPAPATSVTPEGEYYTYLDAGIIFMYNGTSFDTLANLMAKPGDHWQLGANNQGCTSITPVFVTDTGSITLNGIKLKQLGLSYKKIWTSASYTEVVTYTFTERVGDLSGFLIPSLRCHTDDTGDPWLFCYSDNNFPVIKSNGATECDVTTVGIPENKLQTVLSLYPNPSNGVITVQSSVPVSIQVIDHLGRVLYSNDEVPPGLTRIDTDLAEGIYFLVATSDGQKKMIRFVRE